MTSALRPLALRDLHAQAGARLAPFAGWAMPVQYQSILEEHQAVRTKAGIFDVSHLGRVWVRGAEAGALIRSITTYDVLRMEAGQAHYSLYCRDDGGIADDIFIYRLEPERWLIVHNAANAAADYARVAAVAPGAEEVTGESVMLAVQGPLAQGQLRAVLGEAMDGCALHQCAEIGWRGATVVFARTGYTGEDGGECITDPATARALWSAFVEAGVEPCGLGARDTLRLEAALPLHGHDIDETTHPYEAGLGWAVSLDDNRPFRGREALARLKSAPLSRRLSCLRAQDKGVPRAGYAVRLGSGVVTALTSGAYSPTLRVGIGLAYLPAEASAAGTPVEVDIRGRRLPMEVVRRPFYKRAV